MMAITTSSSISVKPWRAVRRTWNGLCSWQSSSREMASAFDRRETESRSDDVESALFDRFSGGIPGPFVVVGGPLPGTPAA